jgi:hypothetical protein
MNRKLDLLSARYEENDYVPVVSFNSLLDPGLYKDAEQNAITCPYHGWKA